MKEGTYVSFSTLEAEQITGLQRIYVGYILKSEFLLYYCSRNRTIFCLQLLAFKSTCTAPIQGSSVHQKNQENEDNSLALESRAPQIPACTCL